MKKQVENKNIKKKYPKIRFKEFSETWEQCQLKEIGKFFSGMSGKSLDNFKTGKDKYITFLNVYQNEVINKKHLENVKANYRDLQVKKNDLFFTISSESPDDVAMASAWIFDDKNVFLNSFCIGFRIFQIFDIYFLVNNLRSPEIRKQIRTFAKGISRFNVSKKELEKIKLSYCTNIEQEKISNLFLRISNLITLHQKKLDLLKKFKKTLLEKMFSLNKESFPKIRFNGFFDAWEQCKVGNLFEITRGETLAKKFITNFKTRKNIYPVYSSQTTNNGLMGYYKTYLFENAITWTTDGYAGNFNYRPEKFYSTNVNGVLMSNNGYANYAVSEIINSVAQKYVTKTANPKLMSNVVNQIKFFAPKIKEQIKISNFIFNLNNLITLHQKKLKLIQKFKKTLLEKMFV